MVGSSSSGGESGSSGLKIKLSQNCSLERCNFVTKLLSYT